MHPSYIVIIDRDTITLFDYTKRKGIFKLIH